MTSIISFFKVWVKALTITCKLWIKEIERKERSALKAFYINEIKMKLWLNII